MRDDAGATRPTARGGTRTADDDRTATALKLLVVLARSFAAVTKRTEADIARHGLTAGEFAVLEVLHHKGPQLLGEVQRRILISSGGVTYLVDRLEGHGLVERRPCSTDRRARYAALTDAGSRLMADIFPEHAEAVAATMSGLTPDEQRQAIDLLRKLGVSATQEEA